jgi:hypothetical protein
MYGYSGLGEWTPQMNKFEEYRKNAEEAQGQADCDDIT